MNYLEVFLIENNRNWRSWIYWFPSYKKIDKEGHEVLILDVLHPYYSIERKKCHLEFVSEAGKFHFYQESLIHNEDKVREIFISFKPEIVIHLAAIPGVPHSIAARMSM